MTGITPGHTHPIVPAPGGAPAPAPTPTPTPAPDPKHLAFQSPVQQTGQFPKQHELQIPVEGGGDIAGASGAEDLDIALMEPDGVLAGGPLGLGKPGMKGMAVPSIPLASMWSPLQVPHGLGGAMGGCGPAAAKQHFQHGLDAWMPGIGGAAGQGGQVPHAKGGAVPPAKGAPPAATGIAGAAGSGSSTPTTTAAKPSATQSTKAGGPASTAAPSVGTTGIGGALGGAAALGGGANADIMAALTSLMQMLTQLIAQLQGAVDGGGPVQQGPIQSKGGGPVEPPMDDMSSNDLPVAEPYYGGGAIGGAGGYGMPAPQFATRAEREAYARGVLAASFDSQYGAPTEPADPFAMGGGMMFPEGPDGKTHVGGSYGFDGKAHIGGAFGFDGKSHIAGAEGIGQVEQILPAPKTAPAAPPPPASTAPTTVATASADEPPAPPTSTT